MDLLVTYDIDTTTEKGRRRLRKVAKFLEGYGQRVQQSVFEVVCSEVGYVKMVGELAILIDASMDSIRVYRLPKSALDDVMELGSSFDIEHRGPLII